uniref:Uncharacterized protein n=1 Tax=Strigamia maritima TaxID=126957 RepID=T1IKU7_STRMM
MIIFPIVQSGTMVTTYNTKIQQKNMYNLFNFFLIIFYLLLLTELIKVKRCTQPKSQTTSQVHLCLTPEDEDMTNFIDHQPPARIPKIEADRIYSVSADMHITQALVIFVCEGPSTSPVHKVIGPSHPFYSEKEIRYFRLTSIPANESTEESYRGEFCELQHIDQPIWFPMRLDPQNQTVVCAKRVHQLEKHPVTGNMLISHGLMHRGSEPFDKIETNQFLVDPPVKGVRWITTEFKNITANQPFELSLEILDENDARITSGFASTLMVEVTLSYDLKHFYGTSLKAGFLYKTLATLAGREVKISKRTNDRILQKRAEKGWVHFKDVRILEKTTGTSLEYGLNATLLIPRGFWNRVPNDYKDFVCIKQSYPDGPPTESAKRKSPRLYIEGSYPWQLADTEEKEYYTFTYNAQCVVSSKAIQLTDKFSVAGNTQTSYHIPSERT